MNHRPEPAITVFEIVDARGNGEMYIDPLPLTDAAAAVPPPWLAAAGHVTGKHGELEWDVRRRSDDISAVDVVAEFDLRGRRAWVSAQAIVFVDAATVTPDDVRGLLDLADDVRRFCFAAPSAVPFIRALLNTPG